MIFISPKVIYRANKFKKETKSIPIYKFTTQQMGIFLVYFRLVLIFLEVNYYSNNKGVGWFTIRFPPILMLLV
jgi:hypothetical protein